MSFVGERAVEQELLNRVLNLSLHDRAELVDRLMHSLDSDPSKPDAMQKWNREIARRVEEFESGDFVSYDATEVMEELKNMGDEDE